MEVASQHCDTVPNKTKTFYEHDSLVRHPVQSSVRGMPRTFIFSLGQLTVETVEINRKV